MKSFYTFLCVLGSVLLSGFAASAQDGWPKTVSLENGTVVKLYQWQPESYNDNTLQAKAAISVLESGKSDPVFGMAWLKANTTSNGNEVRVESAQITNIKLPDETDNDKLDNIADALERKIGGGTISFARSDLQSSLELSTKEAALSQQISNAPPKVIYSTNPSILVLIDGAPKVQHNSELNADVVVNSPFTIIKNSDGRYYLYGGKHWYVAPAATGPYALTTEVSSKLNAVAQQVNEANKNDGTEKEADANTMYKVIVSTEPAELIQSNGEANFAPVSGTELLYVNNSEDDIFMDTRSQQYYVLISGRWYKSKTLSGQWVYTGADKLPEDFARIPEGSPKDNVLASVAGTDASQEALQDAEVPQTAKVDRQQAKADVMYDGDPQFEDIDGTDMDYAVNTSAQVIRWRGRYYSVDNGIWFESNNAMGPWSVAVTRPYVVSMIPPRYPVYQMKYVYIYDVTPDYVWMGYTPGYLNTYAYGPTVVYGTGYYYRPWYGNYYFPRPYTWGFSIRYNPWFGWGFGFDYNSGWFHSGAGWGNPWDYGYGGWWGPRIYRPSYCYSPYRSNGGNYRGGYYSNGYRNRMSSNIVYGNRTNNIYRNNYHNRAVVSTRDNYRGAPINRARDFNNREGYANRGYTNRDVNRNNGARFDNNRAATGNGNRRYDNNTPGNNGGNRANPVTNGQRPVREWRKNEPGNNGPANGGRTPGTPNQAGSTSGGRNNTNGVPRNNTNGGRTNNGSTNQTPVNRDPRTTQPNGGGQQPARVGGASNGGRYENRSANPGRVAQPQPQQPQTRQQPQYQQPQQPRQQPQVQQPQSQPRQAAPQRSNEQRSSNGTGGGGGQYRGGSSSGGNSGGSSGGGGSARPARTSEHRSGEGRRG